MKENHRRLVSPDKGETGGSQSLCPTWRGQQSGSKDKVLRRARASHMASMTVRTGLWVLHFKFLSLANFMNCFLPILSLKMLDIYYRRFRLMKQNAPKRKFL